MYIFYYKKLILGGAELLIEKLGRGLISIGEKVCVCCEDLADDMERRLETSNILIYKKIYVHKLNNFRDFFSEYKSLNVICFQIIDFCYLKHSIYSQDRILLYVMHYASLCMGMKGRNKILKRFWKSIIPKLLKKMDANHELVVMDEITADYTKKYFKSRVINEIAFHIVRVPVDIVEFEEKTLHNKYFCNNILAIARADFPFKGYLIGLLDHMNKIPENISLDIISYGKDLEILEKQYNSLTHEHKQRVHLYGKTNFEDLEEHFNRAKVYIGMGTTILDAAQRGIVSIPVRSDTFELFATNYFHNDYRKLLDDSIGRNNKALQLIKEIFALEQEKYIEQALANRRAVVENYGVDKIVKELTHYFDYRTNLKYYVEAIVRKEYKIKILLKSRQN